MSVRNQENIMRVYHLQSPGPHGGRQWDRYIEIIRKFHTDVGNIINSFSWEDYGYDPQTQDALRKGHRKLIPEAVILLHYDSTSQTWYYASQMNLYGMRVYERNNIAVLVAKNDDKYFNGR